MESNISPLEEKMQMLDHNIKIDLREGLEGLEKKPVVYPLSVFFSIKSKDEYRVNVSLNNGKVIYQSEYLQAVPAFRLFNRVRGFLEANGVRCNKGNPVEEKS